MARRRQDERALKTATKNLLDQLKAAATKNGDVYVSIIPFSKDVNAEPSNYVQSWVRWDLWEETNGSCKRANDHHATRTEYQQEQAAQATGRTWDCAKPHDTWNGCVTDRDQDYDTKNTAAERDNRRPPCSRPSNTAPARCR